MKKLVTIGYFLTALWLCGCGPAATFDKPQPDQARSMTSFPKRLQGKYISADQASIVTITNMMITRHYSFEVIEHKDSIESFYKLAGDTLIDQTDGTKEHVMVEDDSITRKVNWTDTLFRISAENVLKKFKGYYFLNNYHDKNTWEVKKLSLQKGILSVGYISGSEDIEQLKEITETTLDTSATHFVLSRRQFRKFVNQAGFREEETFTRITEIDR